MMFYDIHLQETACKSVSYDVLNGVSALLLINGSPVLAQQAEPIRDISKGCRDAALFYWPLVMLDQSKASSPPPPHENPP